MRGILAKSAEKVKTKGYEWKVTALWTVHVKPNDSIDESFEGERSFCFSQLGVCLAHFGNLLGDECRAQAGVAHEMPKFAFRQEILCVGTFGNIQANQVLSLELQSANEAPLNLGSTQLFRTLQRMRWLEPRRGPMLWPLASPREG